MPAIEEEIEGDANPEADGDVGNEDAREEIGAAGGEENYSRPEAGLRRQEAAAEEIEKEGQGEDAQMEREAGAPGVDTEELEAEGDAPIGKRGFFKVADAVFVKSDPVVADEDFAAGVGVGSVDIVLKGRGEKTGAIDGEPEEKEDDERGPGALSDGAKHSERKPQRGVTDAKTSRKQNSSLACALAGTTEKSRKNWTLRRRVR